jgi:hypothetical protein
MLKLDVAAAGPDLGAGFNEDRLDPKWSRHPLSSSAAGAKYSAL